MDVNVRKARAADSISFGGKLVWSRVEEMFHILITLMRGFQIVFIADLFLIILGLVVSCIAIRFPFLMNFLAVSVNTPWGILTSLLLHKDWLHFSQNMISLLFYAFLFATTNMHLISQEKGKRSSFFLRVIFFSAILANVIWIIILPKEKSIGSSGIVYASVGTTMGFSLNNTFRDFRSMWRNLKKKNISLKNFLKENLLGIWNLFVFSLILIYIIIDPAGFLSAGLGVNTVVHFTGFLMAFLVTIITQRSDVGGEVSPLTEEHARYREYQKPFNMPERKFPEEETV
jgi:membrane associated rhomboid family serine protease